MRSLLFCLLVVFALGSARAAEPFFKKNDVIALVGGEDMVVASEYGYLETLLTRALPDYHLRFRNLAWEGDTVYEQRRDLNFPSWEEQLDKIGATVVICQFGQMEGLDGDAAIPKFYAAYGALLEHLSGGGKRRLILLTPFRFAQTSALALEGQASVAWQKRLKSEQNVQQGYVAAIGAFAENGRPLAGLPSLDREKISHNHLVDVFDLGIDDVVVQRDGIHLNNRGHQMLAHDFCLRTGITMDMRLDAPDLEPLRQLIVAKNKLWFDYWRVENWAFLFGDRTNQPSSRDWRDPSKRWFPAEREEFIPLIEAKEKEIDALAQKLAQP